MPSWLIPLLTQLAPLVFSALAPFFTMLTEKIGLSTGAPLPNAAKPVVNAAAGVGLATLVGGNPVVGVVGAMLGNRIREAMNRPPVIPNPVP